MKNKPIKRFEELQPLSREHHHGLLLSWKIKQGVSKSIESKRIAAYVNWFYEKFLTDHFQMEERWVFPVLGAADPLVKRALKEHRQIERMMSEDEMDYSHLLEFADLLNDHIRFEERKLFNKVQDAASQDELSEIEKRHNSDGVSDNGWEDQFWMKGG
ncbi:hemerythrin domain-containing protein [Halocola ammonii]